LVQYRKRYDEKTINHRVVDIYLIISAIDEVNEMGDYISISS